MRDLPRWQHQYLGLESVPRNIGELELSAFFTFSPSELRKLNTLRRPELRVGAAVQLGFLKMTGRTLEGVDVVPSVLLKHIGKQLNVPAPSIASLKAILFKDEPSGVLGAIKQQRANLKKPSVTADELLAAFRGRFVFGAICDGRKTSTGVAMVS